MKRISFILLALLSALTAQAQEKNTITLTDTTIWRYHGHKSSDQFALFMEKYRFEGTEMKNGKTYRILSFNRSFFDGAASTRADGSETPEPELEGPDKKIGIREENGRVYVDRDTYLSLLEEKARWYMVGRSDYVPYPQTADGELLIYDFNVGKGEKYLCDDFVVEDVTVVTTMDGIQRRQLILNTGEKIIEGIGCVNSTGMFLFYLNPKITEYDIGFLAELFFVKETIDGKALSYIFEQSLSDVVVNGISSLTLQSATDAPLYDLQGRRLSAKPAKGMYIQDGRKYVVK